MLDKIDFNTKNVTKDKEGHYISIKGIIQEEDITIVSIYDESTQIHKANSKYKGSNQ